MRLFGRTATVLGLACLVQVPAVFAQVTGFETFKWYVGAQAGVTIFETQSQTRGGIFTAGGNLLVTAKRTGLLITVEEGLKRNQLSSVLDTSVTGTSTAPTQVSVTFNDIRKYSISLLAFPFRTVAQPYVGLGVGWLQTVKEYPAGATPATAAGLQDLAERAGSFGFGSFTAGVQARVDRFMVFGQYQITSAAAPGKLFVGSTHAFTAGMRISLGGAREGVTGAGPGSD